MIINSQYQLPVATYVVSVFITVMRKIVLSVLIIF